MRISVTIPEDCYDASLPIRGIADSQGKPFLDVPGAFECLFEGEVAEASFDPVARMIHFKATDDGRAGGQGKITLKTGTAQLTVDVFLDPPTASDIIADPADLIIRMTAPPIVQDPPIADPIVQDPPPIAEPDPVA